MLKTNAAQRARQLTERALSTMRQSAFGAIARSLREKQEPGFADLVAQYDVVMMKHCFPASDVLEDIGRPEPASPRQSLENYKAIYRLLRNKFDENPERLFILWTLPPRHRLFEPSEGSRDANAARATAFSHWLEGDFLQEGGVHPNINIWDFRRIVMDPATNYLKYEYELAHNSPDSHPNKLANNEAGPGLARFIVGAMAKFYGDSKDGQKVKIIFLHHSTGLNVYRYPVQGIPAWFKKYDTTGRIVHSISHKWYPQAGNMPAHYYHCWLEGR